jgi:two-component system chemotaxis response regulator CheB
MKPDDVAEIDPRVQHTAVRDIFVIGASAGALAVLCRMLRELPAGFPASLFVVVHTKPDSVSYLASLLEGASPLPVSAPADMTPVRRGHVYVSIPDHHMLLERDRIRMVRGPKENRHRPAIDPLFRSAAWTYGPRVAGIVLTGYLNDGAAGLWAIKTCGGATIVQDPADAAYPDMPRNAIHQVDVDYCLPAREMPALMQRLALEQIDPSRVAPPPPSIGTEVEVAALERRIHIPDMGQVGKLSAFTCPTCHGALWELQDDSLLRYRCHTGHAFSGDALVDEQTATLEETLYSAMRVMEEKATALRRLKENWHGRFPELEADYESRAREMDASIQVLQGLLARGKG